MKRGIICELSESYSPSSFYFALQNIFDSVSIVKSKQDLEYLDFLFIGGDHYGPHISIWRNQDFINTVNYLGLKVCVFSTEKIFNDFYPWNWNIQKDLQNFDNLYQRVLDVDDAITLNKKIARCLPSINYKHLTKEYQKKDEICFIGSIHLPHYQKRKELLDNLQKKLKIDFYESSTNRRWVDYLNILGSYKFVLNLPSTNFNGFCGRFYETLIVKSIPLQHVYPNTLSLHPYESNRNDIVFYENEEDLIEKIEKIDIVQSDYSVWLEDEIINFFREDLGIII